jgi:hypothetical protein
MKKIIINYFVLPLLISSMAITPSYGMLKSFSATSFSESCSVATSGALFGSIVGTSLLVGGVASALINTIERLKPVTKSCMTAAIALATGASIYIVATSDAIHPQVFPKTFAHKCYLSLIYLSTYFISGVGIPVCGLGIAVNKRIITDKFYLAKLKIQKYIRSKFFTVSNSITDEEQAKIDTFFMLLEEYVEFRKAKALDDYLLLLRIQLEEQLKVLQQCPSITHIAGNLNDIIWSYRQYKLNNLAIQKTIATGLSKEKELIAQGLVPFVHGRRRSYDFVTQLYAFLNATTTGKKINPDFIPTHIKVPVTDIEQEKNIRKELLADGNHDYDQKKRQKLLFLNHFMFGNTNNSGSNSFLYMLSNNNAGGVNIHKKDIFKMFGLEAMYNKYAIQLNALEKEYNEVSPLGQMLQLGIEPKKVQKAVYLTTSGGPKQSLQISDTTSSDQIDTIITHLDEHPKDVTEFALINTFDKYGGLNEYGMKISVLDPADYDPESLAKKIVCNNKRDALFSAIQSDCMATKEQINITGVAL